MNLAPLAFAAAVFCLGAPAFAEPEPAAPAETAVEPPAAPVMPIRVGGPCTYETTEIVATVAQVTNSTVTLTPMEGRAFGIGRRIFAEKGAEPEAGQVFSVTRRAITKGTCVPVIYELIGPATDEVPAAPAN